MDEETVGLIISLQVEDLRSLVARRKGKSAVGSPCTDEELAVDLQTKELESRQTTLADFCMARSISRAVQDDGATIAILTAEERRSIQDHEMACRLSGQSPRTVRRIPDYRVDDVLLSKLGSLNVCQAEDVESCYGESVVSFGETEAGESSSWAAGRKTSRTRAQHECVACTELRETIQMPCQHQYCTRCVIRLISDATVDESLFPPRCCGQTIPLSLVRPYISGDLTVRIEQKAIEFNAPYRTYCTSCGSFIKLYDTEGNRGHCPACNQDTCVLCKRRFHNGDCPKDTALEDVLRIADEAGWQRCLGCHTMVERREGCNHMK